MADRRFGFMDPLVLAIAAGEKDVTRRMSARQPCEVGDTILVCEALIPSSHMREDGAPGVLYRCDAAIVGTVSRSWPWKVTVLPARYCPTWAVRHRRVCTAIHREPLSLVTDDEARREGIARLGWPVTAAGFVEGFRELHDLGRDEDVSPWRIEFRREVSP